MTAREEELKEAYAAGFDGNLRKLDEIIARAESCGICGGALVRTRGRFPKDPDRLVCPSCLQTRIERALDILGPATYEAKEAKP